MAHMLYLPSGTAFRFHVMVLPKRGKGSNLMKSEEKQDKDDFTYQGPSNRTLGGWSHDQLPKMGGLYTPTAFLSGLQADSVGLRVSRIHIFLLFRHSIFPMIFRCLSGHFWSDHKVQRTFPMDFQWTNSKPTPK